MQSSSQIIITNSQRFTDRMSFLSPNQSVRALKENFSAGLTVCNAAPQSCQTLSPATTVMGDQTEHSVALCTASHGEYCVCKILTARVPGVVCKLYRVTQKDDDDVCFGC